MVVLRDGRDDFNALQGRLSAENREPAVYMLFDMPHCNGRSLRHVPLLERKALLHELLRDNAAPALRFSEHVVGNGAAVFAKAVAAGLEGIVSKRVDSGYSGTRNGDWIKIKGRPSDEFVVVGFTEPKGSRTGIGALLLARVHDGGLQYAGRVGTGFDQAQLTALREQLRKTVVATPPADIALLARKDRALAIWVRPALIVEVAYQGIGSQGLLRQVSLKGLRPDKTLKDLVDDARRAARTARKAKPRK
jgi:bifunctional non-homologous end joining protein LigD